VTIPLPQDTPLLIKPFTGLVNASGIAVVKITHGLHGLAWRVYQIGFALGKLAPSPQVAAHMNGIPLVASVTMQSSAFSQIPQEAPYAMETFFYGPPYVNLEAGDYILCAVNGAIVGDTFTVGVFINEMISPAAQYARANYGR